MPKPGKLPSLPRLGTLPRPPRLRNTFPIAPKGPHIYHRGSKPFVGDTRWLNPPEGFVTAHTSSTEWMFYLALSIITGSPNHPEQAPFLGGPPIWVYQKSEQGGRVPGGSVSDFVVLNWKGTSMIGIRIETERYHIWTDGATQQKDLYINSHLSMVNKVIRVWDQDILDPTGEKTCRVAALALKGIEMPNPIYFGTARRTRI